MGIKEIELYLSYISFIYSLSALHGTLIVIAMFDLIQTGDQLIEGLTIDDQTANTLGTFTDYVRRAQIIAVEKLRGINQIYIESLLRLTPAAPSRQRSLPCPAS